jgi:hypothetical protein
MSQLFEDDWDMSGRVPKLRRGGSQAIHPGEALQNMKGDVLRAPKAVLEILLCPSTYLVWALLVGIPLVFYTSFALLFGYLPARAFGYTKGTPQLDIRGLFQEVIAAEDYNRGKPFPDPFLTAAARLGLAPETCLVFEDTATGTEAARAAGMAWVLV